MTKLSLLAIYKFQNADAKGKLQKVFFGLVSIFLFNFFFDLFANGVHSGLTRWKISRKVPRGTATSIKTIIFQMKITMNLKFLNPHCFMESLKKRSSNIVTTYLRAIMRPLCQKAPLVVQ